MKPAEIGQVSTIMGKSTLNKGRKNWFFKEFSFIEIFAFLAIILILFCVISLGIEQNIEIKNKKTIYIGIVKNISYVSSGFLGSIDSSVVEFENGNKFLTKKHIAFDKRCAEVKQYKNIFYDEIRNEINLIECN